MKKKSKKEFYETVKQFDFYALVDEDSKKCYVWKTTNPNLKKVYEVHVQMRIVQTKEMFASGRARGKLPGIYILETDECSGEIAYKHCLAWIRYFIEHGFAIQNWETVQNQAQCMDEDTEDIYEAIRDRLLSDVMAKEHRLFANYGTIRHKRTGQNGKRQICITLTPEEYEKVLTNAEQKGLKRSEYLKEMALHGTAYVEKYDMFKEGAERLRVIERRMRGILKTVYERQIYYPADLINLQKLCDETEAIHKEVMTAFYKKKYGKRTRRKP